MTAYADNRAGFAESHVIGPGTLLPQKGILAGCAADGTAVVLVRLASGAIHALGQRDPYSHADVMSMGSLDKVTVLDQERDVIVSPMYKQAFDLRTGQCTSDPDVNLGVWDVEESEGMIVLRNNRIAPRGVA